jgi:hypothetical protein
MKAETLKKYALPEVVLLAVLVAGFGIAHLIVQSRSYITLSPPGEVPASGFWFSLPQGRGWQAMPTEKFAQNSYYRTSVQITDNDKNAARLTVTYMLAAGKIDANDWLKVRAAQLGGSISDIRRIEGQNVVTQAALFAIRGQPLSIFYGIASLPGGRNVVIEAIDTSNGDEWAWDVVTNVAKSFIFKGNPLLETGEKLIASIRNKGLGQLLGMARQEDDFLVHEDGVTQGFSTTMYARMGNDAEMNVRMIESYYVNSLGGRESVLQTNDRFDKFTWLCNALDSAGTRKRLAEVRLGDDAAMNVQVQGDRYAETYEPGPAAIPDSLAPVVFKEMLADGIKEAIVDYISSDGRILPVIIQLQDHLADSNNRLGHAVTVKYFGETDMSEEITLNADGQTERNVVSGQAPYMLNRSSRELILNEFPLWLDYFMNIEKLLMKDAVDSTKNPRRIVRNVTMP